MVTLKIQIHASEKERADFLALVGPLLDRIRNLPGCIESVIHDQAPDADHFELIVKWVGQQEFTNYCDGEDHDLLLAAIAGLEVPPRVVFMPGTPQASS